MVVFWLDMKKIVNMILIFISQFIILYFVAYFLSVVVEISKERTFFAIYGISHFIITVFIWFLFRYYGKKYFSNRVFWKIISILDMIIVIIIPTLFFILVLGGFPFVVGVR